MFVPVMSESSHAFIDYNLQPLRPFSGSSTIHIELDLCMHFFVLNRSTHRYQIQLQAFRLVINPCHQAQLMC